MMIDELIRLKKLPLLFYSRVQGIESVNKNFLTNRAFNLILIDWPNEKEVVLESALSEEVVVS
jgi:hypothetical protein